jgi:hypothetical protein
VVYSIKRNRACGAVGSALPWHGRGREFESHQVHQNKAQQNIDLRKCLCASTSRKRSPGVHLESKLAKIWTPTGGSRCREPDSARTFGELVAGVVPVLMSPAARQIVENMTGVLVQAAHPKRIILFGSLARGDAAPHSDFDESCMIRVEDLLGIRVAQTKRSLSFDGSIARTEKAWRKNQ